MSTLAVVQCWFWLWLWLNTIRRFFSFIQNDINLLCWVQVSIIQFWEFSYHAMFLFLHLDSDFESYSLKSLYNCKHAHILFSFFFISLKLQCHDEDVIEGVVCIFKRALFKANHSPGSSLTDTRQMDSVLPLLLNLLDEQDGTARAVVKLIAEYCSMYFFL